MTYRSFLVGWAAMLFLSAGTIAVPAQSSGVLGIGLNRIEGRITDESNIGVNNAFVELYDNFGSLINRQRSTGQGRFSFRGMGPGRYTVSVKPYGTNLLEDSREIEINNQYSRSDTVIVDFRLRLDKRFRSEVNVIVGTIFAQEVPEDAQRLYTSAIERFQSNPERALVELEGAIKLFPRYFNALAALGKANVIKAKYDVGYPYLLRAIDVNSKCSDCYYSLALAFYKLDQLPAAKMAVDAAVLLQPQAAAVRLLQGIIYRMNGDLAGAEKALLTANALSRSPNSEIHWQLSMVYNRLKRNREAADELEKYLATKTDITSAEREKVSQLISQLRKSKE